MKGRLGLVIALVVLVVLFFSVNMVAGGALRGGRVDLTHDRLYTLSEGAKNIARGVEDPIELTYFFSAKLAQGTPNLQAYGKRVRELLEEFARLSRRGGKDMIRLTVIEPEPFSEEEDRATQAGLQGVSLRGGPGQNLFMGIVGTNAVEGREVIPFLSTERDRFLEYDVARLVYSLAHPSKKKVGVISSLQLEGGFTMDPRTQQPRQTEPYQISQEIKGLFEYQTIPPSATDVPDDVDVLLLVHPKNLSDTLLYAVDQYVLRGGKLVACVDPFCENDPAAQGNPMEAMGADRSSNLVKLMAAWGVEVAPGLVAADSRLAVKVDMSRQRGNPDPVSYLPWLRLSKESLAAGDPVTAQLSQVIMMTAGIIRARSDASADKPKAEITPLLTTSEESMELDSARLMTMPDPKGLLSTFSSGGKKLTIAARIGGTVATAFPEGKPPLSAEQAAQLKDKPDPVREHLGTSKGPIHAVVFADADFLSDRTWVQKTVFGPMKQADNGDLLINAIENLIGSSDLLSIRARGEYAKPFTRVEEMARVAEQKFRAEESVIEQKITDTQTRIGELQKKQGDGQAALILTPEAKEEIKKLTDELTESRKKKRSIQSEMRKDIESLGNRLKFVNIGLVPLAVAMLALAMGVYRVSRRGTARRVEAKSGA